MLRLSRVGKKKYPTYKIVVQEKSRDPWGKTIEFLGTYNPHTKELKANKEKIEHWISVGAKMSATVNNLLVKNSIIGGKKRKAAKLNQKKNIAGEKSEKKTEELKQEIKGGPAIAVKKEEAGQETKAEEKSSEATPKTDNKEVKAEKEKDTAEKKEE